MNHPQNQHRVGHLRGLGFLPLIAVLALFLIPIIAAGGTSASLVLRGVVEQKSELTITEQSAAVNLPLERGGDRILVAVIKEVSNAISGYKVTLRSANNPAGTGSILQMAPEGGKSLDRPEYQLEFGGVAVVLRGGVATLSSESGRTTQDGKDKELRITLPANKKYNSGTYGDLLTVTIQPN